MVLYMNAYSKYYFKIQTDTDAQKGELFVMNDHTEQLFEQYADMIYQIAMSYGNQSALAEDVVQEVFLRFLRRKPQFKNSQHEKAWFIRVAVNCCNSMFSSAWMKHTIPLEDARQTILLFQNEEESCLYELV